MILSIVVPHLNRSVFLKETLFSIRDAINNVPQFDSSSIELKVVDNYSDPTHRYKLSMLADIFSEFIFEFREERFEIDESFFDCIKRTSGCYVWIIGDDDLVGPSTLVNILAILNKSKSESRKILHLNKIVFNKNPPILLDSPDSELVIYRGSNTHVRVFRDFMFRPGFISSIVMDRHTWLTPVESEHLYEGYKFLARLYVGLMVSNASFYYFIGSLVAQRKGRASWKSKWTRYQLLSQPLIISLVLGDESQASIKKNLLECWARNYISVFGIFKHGFLSFGMSKDEKNYIKLNLLPILSIQKYLSFYLGRFCAKLFFILRNKLTVVRKIEY